MCDVYRRNATGIGSLTPVRHATHLLIHSHCPMGFHQFKWRRPPAHRLPFLLLSTVMITIAHRD